ncbi:MAG: hypothetical protein KIS62_01380 [Ramlibacter sp.]|nr:hypothetical protein [Ramlibacter sp.]
MSPHALEALYDRLGRPAWFWPVVGALLAGLLLLGSASTPGDAQAGGLVPEEVGLTLRAHHSAHNTGPQAWNNRTEGVYALWTMHEVPAQALRLSALATALTLSTGRPGWGVGGLLEWGHLYTGLTLVHGYERVRYSYSFTPAAVRECVNTCAWRTATPRWAAVVPVGVRVDLGEGWRLRLSYQYNPRRSRPESWWSNRQGEFTDSSWLLSVGRTF